MSPILHRPPPRVLRSIVGWPMLALGALAIAGCSPSTSTTHVAVSGTVDLDGKPLKSGSVLFHPESVARVGGQTESAASAVATIRDGSFMLSAEEGPPPGPARVEIVAHRDLGFALDDEEAVAAAAKKGGRPLSPTLPNVTFRDPKQKSVVISQNGSPFKFELVSGTRQTSRRVD